MAQQLYISVTGTSNIISVSVSDSHIAPTSTAIVIAEATTLSIGDSVTIVMGYVGDNFTALTGYVKEIEVKESEKTYTITIANAMIRAVDFFIASSTPTNPFKRQNIQAEDLVEDIMALAGLTSFASDNSGFTFAISIPVEVNLTPAYDYARFIGNIIAFNLYADNAGVVQFRDRKPYPVGGDASVYTITNVLTTEVAHEKSDRDIRNKVIVYGSGTITATASASSPYLPAGYYRTVVVAAPGVIDSQSMATQAANYNLALLNRLTQKLNMTIQGKTGLFARQCVTVNLPELGISSEKWYIYSIEHNISKAGYTTALELRF
jgi:prophage tail gpP-like protein